MSSQNFGALAIIIMQLERHEVIYGCHLLESVRVEHRLFVCLAFTQQVKGQIF